MELELGFKITIAGEFTSDFQMKQERGEDLVFLSRETNTVFILTLHLKGYTRRNIAIDINEDGTLISIRGERKVKGNVVVEQKAYKKATTGISGFKKVFRIPNDVDLDKIKAEFDKDLSSLTITMPKKARGIRGSAIEEIMEKQELAKDTGNSHPLEDGEKWENTPKKPVHMQEMIVEKEVSPGLETEMLRDKVDEVQHNTDLQLDQPSQHGESSSGMNKEVETQDGMDEVKETDEEKEEPFIAEHQNESLQPEHVEQKPRKSWRTCGPVISGSAFLISLVVFVFQIIRIKHQSSRRKC